MARPGRLSTNRTGAPATRVGMTFGHEFIGVVDEVGPSVRNLRPNDRVMVPFNICGSRYFCARGLLANCHNVNPNATAVGGIYGYSHTCGGYDGGQAEYVLLTDALATGYFGAQLGGVAEGDVVVGFGAGPVGLYAAKSASLLGADVAIDAVGAEADGNLLQHVTGAKLKLQGGSPVALNWAIDSVRKGGTSSVMDAYGPMFSAVKFGDAVNKRLTLRMNQCPVKRQWPRLFEHIAEAYHIFSAKVDGCIKPGGLSGAMRR
jgi:threonine dehydrogenase-like Zn-dependent dehydrogenase